MRCSVLCCLELPTHWKTSKDVSSSRLDCRAEEIFAEPVNPRGPGLRLCQEALEEHGYREQAEAIRHIRKRANWSRHVVDLIRRVQHPVRKHSDIAKLRFLLYRSGLQPEDRAKIKRDDAGVVWLGHEAAGLAR